MKWRDSDWLKGLKTKTQPTPYCSQYRHPETESKDGCQSTYSKEADIAFVKYVLNTIQPKIYQTTLKGAISW